MLNGGEAILLTKFLSGWSERVKYLAVLDDASLHSPTHTHCGSEAERQNLAQFWSFIIITYTPRFQL